MYVIPFHTFVTWTLDGRQWPASCPGLFSVRQELIMPTVRDCVGPTPSPHAVEKKKIPRPESLICARVKNKRCLPRYYSIGKAGTSEA
jgi:hypothetical protein